jgi:hypothetical protein
MKQFLLRSNHIDFSIEKFDFGRARQDRNQRRSQHGERGGFTGATAQKPSIAVSVFYFPRELCETSESSALKPFFFAR